MKDLMNEQDQIDYIKAWWDRYGRTIIFGVVMGLAAIYGVNQWRANHDVYKRKASDTYQALLQSVIREDGEAIEQLGTQLQKDFTRTPYADAASLMLAKHYVYEKDYKKALLQLQFVVDHNHDDLFIALATLRKARIYAEQKQFEQALEALSSIKIAKFAPLVQEVQGDVYLAKGDVNMARSLYQKVISNHHNRDIPKQLVTAKLGDIEQPSMSAPIVKQEKRSGMKPAKSVT